MVHERSTGGQAMKWKLDKWGFLAATVALQACGSPSPGGERTGEAASAVTAGLPFELFCEPACFDRATGPNDEHPGLAILQSVLPPSEVFALAPSLSTVGPSPELSLLVPGEIEADSVSIPPLTTSGWNTFAPQLIVTQVWNPPGGGGIYNDHHTGVWFDGSTWLVYDEDGATPATGASFNVLAGQSLPKGAFSTVIARSGGYSAPVSGATDPSAVLIATHQWNPGGASGVYDDHPVGVGYVGGQWAVVNADRTPLPAGAGFNVVNAESLHVPYVAGVVVVASAANTFGDSVYVGDAHTLGQRGAVLFVSPNLSAGGAVTSPVGVWYDYAMQDWAIFNEDRSAMPLGVAFDVMVTLPLCSDGVQDDGETSVDCGGADFCARCPDGSACIAGSDCASGCCGPSGFCVK
jgi:hypothetical protein